MSIRKSLVIVLISLLALMVLAACNGGGNSTPAVASGKTFNVETTEFAFNPNTFNASVGQPVAFKITNKGTVDHTLVIMGLDGKEVAKANIKTGGTETLQFTPTAAGTYPIVCDLPGHKEAGMQGTLTVK
jgi:plastocyanin